MAVDKLVDSTQLDADLTSVANAIRTKGGTSASLAFPVGFVDAIDAIETGEPSVLSFDFTRSLVEQNVGILAFANSGATQDSTGLHITNNSQYASLDGINLHGKIVEIDVGAVSYNTTVKPTSHKRFITLSNAGAPIKGLAYRYVSSGNYWALYNNAWNPTSAGNKGNDYFANSTIRFEFDVDGDYASVYKDATRVWNHIDVGGHQRICFGDSADAFFAVTILGLRIYTPEAYALKILLGE